MSSCDELAGQLAALSAQISGLNILTEAEVRAIVNAAISPLQQEIDTKLDASQKPVIVQESIFGAQNAIMPLVTAAIAFAVNPIKAGLASLGDLVGAINSQLLALEATVANALKTALSALGLSNQAIADIAELSGKILPILAFVGQIANLLSSIEALETLGQRIDALENEIIAVGQSVSQLLGRLLGIQSRLSNDEGAIAQVRGIAQAAQGLAQTASTRADSAYALAGLAQSTATNAQATATQAQSLGQRALNIGGQALEKAGTALTTALTAIALVQAVKSIRGLQGIPGVPGQKGAKGDKGDPGLPGIPGKQGIPGIQGIPGTPGVTTVVTLPGAPGVPGKDGSPGQTGATGRQGVQGIPGVPGKNGTNGIDGTMNPTDIAALEAFIASQHSATRANINATTTGLFGRLQAFVATANSALTTLITTIATNTYVEKALAVMTFAATIHNAAMLSNNLAQTLGQVINQCISLILPKGINGQPIDVSKIIGNAVTGAVSSLIGAQNLATAQQEWQKANRIYQAASNVYNQTTQAVGLITAGMEMIGGNIGKIGNALKIWGVIGQNAYAFMNPQPNMKGNFFTFLQGATNQVSSIQAVVGTVVALDAAAIAVNASMDAFTKALDQTDPVDKDGHPIIDATTGLPQKYQPGIAVPVPTVTTTVAAQAKVDSTNFIQATIDDIFNAND